MADIDKEVTLEDLETLKTHSEAFAKRREDEPDTNQLNPPDYAAEITYEEQCQDVYFWMRDVLDRSEKILLLQESENGSSLEMRQALSNFRTTKRHMWNLVELLVKGTCNNLILNKFYHIVHYCLIKQYVKAIDKYMDLAIGNAPWPIGVTMVGIHERSGRAKIFSS